MKENKKLFLVLQNANSFEENHYMGYIWANNHDSANKEAKIKYPDGYLVAQIQKDDLTVLLGEISESRGIG